MKSLRILITDEMQFFKWTEHHILFFFLYAITYVPKGFLMREQAICRCSSEKHSFSKLSVHTCCDSHCHLLIIIAKANRAGNCKRLNSKGTAVGIIRMRRISTFCVWNLNNGYVVHSLFHRSCNRLMVRRKIRSTLFSNVKMCLENQVNLRIQLDN